MNLSSFAFESEVIISVMFKVSTNSMRDFGQMLKCHSWYVPQQEQVLLGPAGKWSLHAGRRRGGCSSPCPSAWSFWIGSKSSGPARPTGSGKFDYTLSLICRCPLQMGKQSCHMHLLQMRTQLLGAMSSKNVIVKWICALRVIMSLGNELFVCQRLKQSAH